MLSRKMGMTCKVLQNWIGSLFLCFLLTGLVDGYSCDLYGTGSITYCPDGCCGSSCCYNGYDYYYDGTYPLIIAVIVLSVFLFIAIVIGLVFCIIYCVRRKKYGASQGVVFSVAAIPGQPLIGQVGYISSPHQYNPTTSGFTGTPQVSAPPMTVVDNPTNHMTQGLRGAPQINLNQ